MSNPFSNVGKDLTDEQLKTWEEMNERLRGLVHMSDDDDDDNDVDDDENDNGFEDDSNDDDVIPEGIIDESLMVTDVTAESFGVTRDAKKKEPNDNAGKPSTSMESTSKVLGLPVDTELTLQYLAGKISFVEFSEAMEQASDEVEREIHVEVVCEEPEDLPDVMEEAAAKVPTPRKKIGEEPPRKKVRKRPRRQCDLPKDLEADMGEVNMLFARGKHDEAIKQCLEIVRKAPNANKPFQTLGMIYDDLGDTQKSLQFYLMAAYIDPGHSEEWVRLVDICLELEDIQQAIKCYSMAIKANGKNKRECIYERGKLYEQTGDRKKALEGYQSLLPLLKPDEGEKYFRLAWAISKNFHETGENSKAIEVMSTAFSTHPQRITSEDVNYLVEIQLQEKMYVESLAVLVKHCGVVFQYAGTLVWSASQDRDLTHVEEMVPQSIEVPEMLPIDLRAKLAVCLIHLKHVKLVKAIIQPLLEEDVESNGDLYLDLAEAFIDNSFHKQAVPLLKKLTHSKNYNLAAVWLRYGECLKVLNDIQGAVQAYKTVVKLAPSHIGARMSLSALQQQLGKHEEALETLEHEEVEERKLTKQEQQMLLQKCSLLHSQDRLDELVMTAKQLLFQEWRMLEAEDMTNMQAIRTYKHRKDSIISHFTSKGKESAKFYSYMFRLQNTNKVFVPFLDLFKMFVKLSDALIKAERVEDFEEISLLGMLCPTFFYSSDYKIHPDFEWLILTSSILIKNTMKAYTFGRHIVLENLECPQAWNMFMQVIMVCNDSRHNRFLLRKIIHEPNNIYLGIMNGHTSMATGSYKHSLGEYANVFKRVPTDPMLSLCIALDFIHCASQRFSAKRQFLIAQGMAFLHNYLELRGKCQETYYNLGRALQQINVVYAAIHYYQKALELPPSTGERGGMFDLTKEVAYNLALIYQNSGSPDYARMLLYKHCVI